MKNPNIFEIAQNEVNEINSSELNVYSFAANIEENYITLYAYFSFDLCVKVFYKEYETDGIGYFGGGYNVAKYKKTIDGIQINIVAYKDAPNK